MADLESKIWDHERRITTLETQTAEARLRQVNISATKLALLSAGTGVLIFLLTWLFSSLGWM